MTNVSSWELAAAALVEHPRDAAVVEAALTLMSTLVGSSSGAEAGAAEVRRCKLTVSKPVWKHHWSKRLKL